MSDKQTIESIKDQLIAAQADMIVTLKDALDRAYSEIAMKNDVIRLLKEGKP